jgi:serine/threonine-protein kinase
LKAGHVIAGKYRLEHLAGGGGMGLVWRASHTELGTTVALKVLMAGAERDPAALRRFRREARAAAALRCPHVVDVRDFGHDGVFPYIVMEYLEGESIAARLAHLPGPKLSELSSWITQAAVALDYAHARGFLHRDVKPSNLFLCRTGSAWTLKMLDFGIVKSLHEADAGDNTVVGSPGYLSPEQARGSALDHTTDLWSLAAVIYRAVTAVEPFAASSLAEVVERVCERPVAPPSSLVPALPPALDGFFERAFRREPAERFRSGAELAEALAAIASTAPDLELPVVVTSEHPVAASPRGDSTESWGASFSTDEPRITRSMSEASPKRRFTGVLLAAVASSAALIAFLPALSRLGRDVTKPPLTVPELQAAALPAPTAATGPSSGVKKNVTVVPGSARPSARSPAGPKLTPSTSSIRQASAHSEQRRSAPRATSEPSAAEPTPAASLLARENPVLDPTFGLPLRELGGADQSASSASDRRLDDR